MRRVYASFCFSNIFISMGKKLIISEKQLALIANLINEDNGHQLMVSKIVDNLNLNYEPSFGTYKKGGEFFETPMLHNKVTKEMVTPKSLFDYLNYKYKVGEDFIKQVIRDWFDGFIDKSNRLSKNVKLR